MLVSPLFSEAIFWGISGLLGHVLASGDGFCLLSDQLMDPEDSPHLGNRCPLRLYPDIWDP